MATAYKFTKLQDLATVQLNSNLTLACVPLAETQLIIKYILELAASG